jgi:hypothetical protein
MSRPIWLARRASATPGAKEPNALRRQKRCRTQRDTNPFVADRPRAGPIRLISTTPVNERRRETPILAVPRADYAFRVWRGGEAFDR